MTQVEVLTKELDKLQTSLIQLICIPFFAT